MEPFVLVLWIVIMTAIGALIGQRKGRPVGGAVLGFLLGPLGWLLVGFGQNYGPKCPLCKGTVVKGAVKCMHCGGDLPAVA